MQRSTARRQRADAPMAVRLRVHLTPRAGRDAIEGWSHIAGADRTLRVRVHATPVAGAANEALVRLLAKRLRLARSAVRIVSGASARTKIVEIDGLTTDELTALA
jgi:uncharacterized protein